MMLQDLVLNCVQATRNVAGSFAFQNNGAIVISIWGGNNPAPTAEGLRQRLFEKIAQHPCKYLTASDGCRWVLDDPKFKEWKCSPDKPLLWVRGAPGKGKSHLAAFLRDELGYESASSPCESLVLEFFCDHADARRNTALAVQLGVIHQAASFYSSDAGLSEIISDILENWTTYSKRNALPDSVWCRFESLLIKNNYNASPNRKDYSHTTYFILDGLDECEMESIMFLVRKIESLSQNSSHKQGLYFKTIIFTRPLSIPLTHGAVMNLDDEEYSEQIDCEIAHFVNRSVDSLAEVLRTESQRKSFEEALLQRSHGTFLWVTAVLALLGESHETLRSVVASKDYYLLNSLLPRSLTLKYDRMLLDVLRRKYGRLKDLRTEECVYIIRILSATFRPLNSKSLEQITDLPSGVLSHIENCKHVIVGTDSEGFRLVHPSLGQYLRGQQDLRIPSKVGQQLWPIMSRFSTLLQAASLSFYYVDFLSFSLLAFPLCNLFASLIHLEDPFIKSLFFILLVILSIFVYCSSTFRMRQSITLLMIAKAFRFTLNHCVFRIFAFSEHKIHWILLQKSLNHLVSEEGGLSMGKGRSLSTTRSVIKQNISSFGHYACRFWPDHLFSLLIDCPQTKKELYAQMTLEFLRRHILGWFKALSEDCNLYTGVKAIRKAYQLFELEKTPNSPLASFLQDAERFALRFAPIIERDPNQAYGSALVFSPSCSVIRKTSWDQVNPLFRKIAAVSDDWSPLIRVLHCGASPIRAMSFTPDGEGLILLMEQPLLQTYHVLADTWEQRRLENPLSGVRIAALLPSCDAGISFPAQGTGSYWQLSSGKRVKSLSTNRGRANAVAISRSGDTIATSLDMEMITLSSRDSGEPNNKICSIKEHPVYSVALSNDGQSLCTASMQVKVWSLCSGAATHTYDVRNRTDAHLRVAFSSDGKFVASGTHRGTICLWDLTTSQISWRYQAHESKITSLTFSPCSTLIASASRDHSVQLFDVTDGDPVQKLTGHPAAVGHVVFSPDGRMIASGSVDGTVRLWEAPVAANHSRTECLRPSAPVKSIMGSASGDIVAVLFADDSMKIWNLTTGVPVLCDLSLKKVHKFQLSSDGQFLAVVSTVDKNNIRLWNAIQGVEYGILAGHDTPVRTLLFNRSGRVLASASRKDVRVWDVYGRKEKKKWITDNNNTVQPLVEFGPDDSTIAFTAGNTLKVARGKYPQGQKCHLIHGSTIRAIDFSSNGELIASISNDQMLRVWYVETGKLRQQHELQPSSATTVCFAPDMRSVMCSGRDSGTMTWCLQTGKRAANGMRGQGYSHLSLAPCGGCVTTELGRVNFAPKHEKHSAFVLGNWIFESEKKVLQLPPNLKAVCAAYSSGVLAVGCQSGQVIFLPFSNLGDC